MKVGWLVAVDLVDVFLLEHHRVSEVGHACREVSGAAHIHGVGVRRKAVEHIPVERITQLGGEDGVTLAPPKAVLVLTDKVHVRDISGDGQRLVAFHRERVLVEPEVIALNLPNDDGLVVAFRCRAGNGHRVADLELGCPVRAGGIDGVPFRFLFRIRAVLKRCCTAPGCLQAAKLSGQFVVICLVREDDDVSADAGENLPVVCDISFLLPVCIELSPIYPVQAVVGV